MARLALLLLPATLEVLAVPLSAIILAAELVVGTKIDLCFGKVYSERTLLRCGVGFSNETHFHTIKIHNTVDCGTAQSPPITQQRLLPSQTPKPVQFRCK